jgi:hypothetical protein
MWMTLISYTPAKGTYQEVADYCGNLAKEGNALIYTLEINALIYTYSEIPSKGRTKKGRVVW